MSDETNLTRFQNINILLLDDDKDDFLLTKSILHRTKTIRSRIEWLSDYQEALQICKTNSYDIILVDYKIGPSSGIEFIKEAKEAQCGVPFILLTGIHDEELGIKAIQEGAEDYLVKGELTPALFERSILYSIERCRIRLKEQELQTKDIIARSERHFRSLIENSTEGIAVMDAEGTITFVSQSVQKILGYSPEEIKKKTIQSIIHPQDLIKYQDTIKRLLDGTVDSISEDVRAKHLNGRWSWIKLSVTDRLEDPHVHAFVLNFHDVTNRVRLDHLKDEFLSIASHELKTPLTTVKGYIQLLEKYLKKKEDPKALNYITQCDLYIDKLNQLISDLLDISRIQSGRLILKRSEVQLEPFTKNICDALQHLSPKHTLRFQATCNPSVIIDPERIEQVMTNLISNAVKYSPGEKKIEINLSCTNEHATLSIQDHGIGISPDDQKRLFKRFFRTESAITRFSGLGIGLYISHEIIKRHKGQMWVRSKEHKGATFYFTLPLQR